MLIGLMPMSVFAVPAYNVKCQVTTANDAGGTVYYKVDEGDWTVLPAPGSDGISNIPLPDLESPGANDWFLFLKAVPDTDFFVNSSTSYFHADYEGAGDDSFNMDELLSENGQRFIIIGPDDWFFKIEFDNNEGGPAPVGFFSTPEASEQSEIDTFTLTEGQNYFYLINLDENEVLTSVVFDAEYARFSDYGNFLTIEPVTEGQVYKITVSSEIYRWEWANFNVGYSVGGVEAETPHGVGLEIVNGLPWFGHLEPYYDGQGNPSVPVLNENNDPYVFRGIGLPAHRGSDFALYYNDQPVTDITMLHPSDYLTVEPTETSGIWTLTLTDWEEAQLIYGSETNDPSRRNFLNIHPYVPDFAAYATQNAAATDFIDDFEVTADNNSFFIVNHSNEITLTSVAPQSWCADYTSVSKISDTVYKVEIDRFADYSGTNLQVDYDYTDYQGNPASDHGDIYVRLNNSIPRLLFEYARYDNNAQKHVYPTENDVYWRSELADFPEGTATIAIAFDGTPVTEGLSATGIDLAPNADAPGLYDVTIEKGASGTITYSGADSYNTITVRSVLPNSGLYSSATASFDTLLNSYNDVKLSMADSLYWIFTVPDLDESAVEVTMSAIEGAVSIGTKQAGQNGITVYPITLNKDVIDGRDLSFYIHSSFAVLGGLSEDSYEQVNVWAPESITFVYDDPAHGSGSADPESAYKDDEVTVTITPDSGYEIARYTEGNFNVEFAHGAADGGRLVMKSEQEPDGQYTDNGDGTFTVIMPEDGLWVLPHFALANYTVSGTVANATTGSVNVSLIPDENPDSPFNFSTDAVGADGTVEYSFDNVTFGRYTVTVEQGNKSVVESIDVADDTEVPTITLPDLNIKTEVNNTSNLTVSVSGLSESAEDDVESTVDDAVDKVDAADSPEDLDIKVTMTISGLSAAYENAAKTTIAAVAAEGVTIADVVDITIAVETKVGNDDVTNQLDEENQNVAKTSKVIDIVLTYNVAGKSITVYRIHDGQAAAFTQLAASPAKGSEQDGTFYVDDSAGQIHIYTDKFSVYAIGTENAYALTGSGTGGTVSFTVDGIAATQAASGKTVTIVPSPASGYQFASASAIGESGEELAVSGTTFTMTGEAVTVTAYFNQTQSESGGSGTGGSGAAASDLISPAPATPAAVQFTDVADNAWYKEAVGYVASKDYFKGVTATEFAPDKTMNRAMFATVLYRIAGEPAFSGTSSFSDVESGRYYSTAVAWAEANGFMGGKGSGKFDPNGDISRQEMAVTLYRYAKSNGQGFTGLWAFKLDYSDADQVADWAYEAMCWLTMNKVINGKGGGILDPQGNAKRSEVAQMIMNFDKLSE